MTTPDRSRKKVEDSSEDEEPVAKTPVPFSGKAEGKFRGRVQQYQQSAQYPTLPLYAKDEVVYLLVPGQSQPAGPYLVVAYENGHYQIKRQDTVLHRLGKLSEKSRIRPKVPQSRVMFCILSSSPQSFSVSMTTQYARRQPAFHAGASVKPHFKHHPKRTEVFRKGYPRLAAFLNSDRSFVSFRYFGRLHARILLEKQDEITELEEQLDEVDENESMQHHLCSRRHDRNTTRRDILLKAEEKLKEYNVLLQSYYGHIERPPPRPARTKSLCNWMDGNKPLIPSESLFLDDWDDLCAPCERHDEGGLDRMLESFAVFLHRCGLSRRETSKTRDVNVFIVNQSRVHALSRFLTTVFAVSALTVPIVALYIVNEMSLRLGLVALFTAIFSSSLCWLTQSRNYEVFSATAAYCAVMVVFVGSISERA